jgi:hypothetical protein
VIAAPTFPLIDWLVGLIEGKAALRVVAFTESRGGYIDNVGSTFTRRGTDLGFAYRTGGRVPTDSVVINNYNLEKDDINGVDYRGFRASLAYRINDDWDVLIAQSWQDVDAGGVFYQHPVGSDLQDLNPLEVTLFNDSNTKDKFNNTALTVNGSVSDVGGASDDGGRVRMGHSRLRECAGARHGPKRLPRAGTRGPSLEGSDCAGMRRRRGAHHHGDEDRAKRTMAGNLRAQGRERPLTPAPYATGRHSQPGGGDRTARAGPTRCRHGARHHIHTPPRSSGAIRRRAIGKRTDHDGQCKREAASAPIARSPTRRAGGPDGRTTDSL